MAGPISWQLPRKRCDRFSWIMLDDIGQQSGAAIGIALDDNLVIESDRDVDLLALEDALTKLTKLDRRQAQMIELRFFAGLSIAEVAKVMGMSKRSAEREWTMVRAWLRRELSTRDLA
jgi:RNA polymerase sigma-70 factor, ECF subfamily